MADERKIFCSVVQGICYESRCLYKLSKMVDTKECEQCILRELEKFKTPETNPSEETGSPLKKRRKRKPERAKRKNAAKVTKLTKLTNATLNIRSLAELLGRSVRRTQELAKAGKIPGRKVGAQWVFDRGEIDRYLINQKIDRISQPTEEASTPDATQEGGQDAGDPGEAIDGRERSGS